MSSVLEMSAQGPRAGPSASLQPSWSQVRIQPRMVSFYEHIIIIVIMIIIIINYASYVVRLTWNLKRPH